jgi:cell division protein ZapA
MPQFEVAINGRSYVISCDEGQDQHLSRLAEYVDKRVKELVSSVGQVGEARLLVMASLLIADELSETFAKVRDSNSFTSEQLEEEVANATDSIAARIEHIAAKLEAA